MLLVRGTLVGPALVLRSLHWLGVGEGKSQGTYSQKPWKAGVSGTAGHNWLLSLGLC